MNDGKKHFAFGYLKVIIKKIASVRFYRIHNSYLVNLDYYVHYPGDCMVVILLNNELVILPVSELKQYPFKDKLDDLGLL